jgi:hypothetical protein
MKTIILIFFLINIIINEEIKVPKIYHGHSFGNKSANVKLEIFINLPCPDTKTFWDVSGSKIYREYVSTGKVHLILHQFPLPYVFGK